MDPQLEQRSVAHNQQVMSLILLIEFSQNWETLGAKASDATIKSCQYVVAVRSVVLCRDIQDTIWGKLWF